MFKSEFIATSPVQSGRHPQDARGVGFGSDGRILSRKQEASDELAQARNRWAMGAIESILGERVPASAQFYTASDVPDAMLVAHGDLRYLVMPLGTVDQQNHFAEQDKSLREDSAGYVVDTRRVAGIGCIRYALPVGGSL